MGLLAEKTLKKGATCAGAYAAYGKKASSQGPTLNFAVMFEHTFGLDIT